MRSWGNLQKSWAGKGSFQKISILALEISLKSKMMILPVLQEMALQETIPSRPHKRRKAIHFRASMVRWRPVNLWRGTRKPCWPNNRCTRTFLRSGLRPTQQLVRISLGIDEPFFFRWGRNDWETIFFLPCHWKTCPGVSGKRCKALLVFWLVLVLFFFGVVAFLKTVRFVRHVRPRF